jgi:cytosine/adenosine deaminase-related metal-dependent hydrolase
MVVQGSVAVINCKQVVTLAGPKRPRVGDELKELSIIDDGGIFLRDGLIDRVGPRAEIESAIDSNTEVIDAGGRIVLPGSSTPIRIRSLPVIAPMSLKNELLALRTRK